MARSRSGGTSGLLSGKLGDVIYSITRNQDGSFRQQIASAPEYRENPNTFDQARARCTMATIERAMFTFRDFMGNGWEGVPLGTLSVSAFSQYNYNAIKEFLMVMFDDDSNYEVMWNLPKKGQTQPRGGTFRLSQGSLRIHRHWRLAYGGTSTPYWKISSLDYVGDGTVRSWLAVNGLEIGDQLVFVQFMEGLTPSKAMVQYVIVATELNVNPNTVITNQNFRNLLVLKSNVPCSVVFNNTTKILSIEFTQGVNYQLKCMSCNTVRLRRVVNGKFLYNNADLFTESSDPVHDYGWQGMRTVRPSWLNSE